MTTSPLNPPVSPRDPQRPATSADIATDDLAYRAWLDYVNDMQARAANTRDTMRGRYFAACITGRIGLDGQPTGRGRALRYVSGPCPYCLQPHSDLQRRDAHGATLGEILKSRGLARITLATWAGISWSYIDAIVYGTKSPSHEVRRKIAAALGYDPHSISWPERPERKEQVS